MMRAITSRFNPHSPMSTASSKPFSAAIRDFVKLESSGGIALLLATIVAMIIANSPLNGLYETTLNTRVAVLIGEAGIDKPLFLWINDGLMAIFFFLIGLEIKREFLEGELSSWSQITLPAFGAVGGMVVPAGIYVWINLGDPVALDGWAIPVATDIAFALALLSVFGARVPISLKVFLLTLAIFDDLAAITIIALFYSADLSVEALGTGVAFLVLLVVMNRMGVTRLSGYLLIGLCLWVAVLKSGVHATLAGVLIAFCIPMRDAEGHSPLRELEHDLHTPVAFAILPIFAFANAGIALAGTSLEDVLHPVTTSIVLGLLVGKPIGVMFFTGLAVLLGLASLPKDIRWIHVLGVSFACGIGFTMSLFIAGLAFEHGSGDYFSGDRLGILIGSILSALAAFVLLSLSLPKSAEQLGNDKDKDNDSLETS